MRIHWVWKESDRNCCLSVCLSICLSVVMANEGAMTSKGDKSKKKNRTKQGGNCRKDEEKDWIVTMNRRRQEDDGTVLPHTHAQSDAHETMVEETSVDVADVNERSQTGTATTIPAMSSSPTTDKTHKGNDAATFKSRFQLFLLSLMVCQNTATVLMFRYLRFTVPPAHRFHISHFIFVVEVSKVRVSECMCVLVCDRD